jgi:hypothetical protein
LLRPGPPQNRTCTFQRIRLKQAGEGPVARRRTIRSLSWSVSSAGPFTATLVAASNLSVGSGVVVIFASLAHLTASARFRARAQARYPAGYPGRPPGGGDRHVPVPRCLSTTGVRFSVIRCPPGNWAFLTVGLPATPAGAFRTSTGLPRSARTSCDRDGCPLYPGDAGAHPGRGTCSAGACRSATARLFVPAPSHRQGSASRGIDEVHAVHPSGLPWPVAARVERAALGLPRASHPAVTGDARRGWDRPSSTDLELHAHIRLIPSNPVVQSLRATSRRTVPSRRLGGVGADDRVQAKAEAVSPVGACDTAVATLYRQSRPSPGARRARTPALKLEDPDG